MAGPSGSSSGRREAECCCVSEKWEPAPEKLLGGRSAEKRYGKRFFKSLFGESRLNATDERFFVPIALACISRFAQFRPLMSYARYISL